MVSMEAVSPCHFSRDFLATLAERNHAPDEVAALVLEKIPPVWDAFYAQFQMAVQSLTDSGKPVNDFIDGMLALIEQEKSRLFRALWSYSQFHPDQVEFRRQGLAYPLDWSEAQANIDAVTREITAIAQSISAVLNKRRARLYTYIRPNRMDGFVAVDSEGCGVLKI